MLNALALGQKLVSQLDGQTLGNYSNVLTYVTRQYPALRTGQICQVADYVYCNQDQTAVAA